MLALHFYLVMNFSHNCEGYTEFVRYISLSRGEGGFLQRTVYLSVLLQGFINFIIYLNYSILIMNLLSSRLLS